MAQAVKYVAVWVDNTGQGNALATDVFHGMVLNSTKMRAVPFPTNKTRADLTVEVPAPIGWLTTDKFTIIGAFRRADGSDASDTFRSATIN
jgi:hypothetical protein